MSGTTAQVGAWKAKESSAENQYARQKETEQLAALREQILNQEAAKKTEAKEAADSRDKDFEGGYGGQEDLEDRYATTSGEH